MSVRSRLGQLYQVAALYGAQTAYYDAAGRRIQASPEALLATLRVLGAPVSSLEDVPDALRERRHDLWSRGVEPVCVAWQGRPASVTLRVPVDVGVAHCRLTLEDGEQRRWVSNVDELPTVGAAHNVEGMRFVAKRLALPLRLPLGYHRLGVEVGNQQYDCLVIAAPVRAWALPVDGGRRRWGVFLPLYALHSARSWGAGDVADWERLQRWVGNLGGDAVATLPTLAGFLDTPYNPSPYAPASRRFWNEFYADVGQVPALAGCPELMQDLLAPAVLRELEALRAAPLVDYRRTMALKRAVFDAASRRLFAASPRHEAFQRFVQGRPHVEDYARFRAAVEQQAAGWCHWPARQRDGDLRPGDYDEDAARSHLFAQWVIDSQMEALAAGARRDGLGLYLDLPLGVPVDSYDVWRERDAFAFGASVGAPPDAIVRRGQVWGFPPLHPERMRARGYRYFIEVVRHHLRHAGVLRIDHVMGCHRAYVVPSGLEARDGVYVRYWPDEVYGILALESHRHRTPLVGEDLGTLPSAVQQAMRQRDVHGMYVLQLEARPRAPLKSPPPDAVASVNTHDLPPFAGFWNAVDVDERVALGTLDRAGGRAEKQRRRQARRALIDALRQHGDLPAAGSVSEKDVLRAALAFLAASPAPLVLVNLEDLWLETESQNVPGTWLERANWQLKARHSFEELTVMPEVLEALRLVDRLRRAGPPPAALRSAVRPRRQRRRPAPV